MSGRSACHGVRTRLLEGADLSDIRETERAHLERCAACRAALGRVETQMTVLAGAIDGFEPALSADDAVALATGAATGPPGRQDPARADGRSDRAASVRRSTRRRLAWAAGPAVALAAAILAIVWAGPWRPGNGVRPPPEALVAGTRSSGAAEFGGLSVEAPATGGVAVFATRDPQIHVVWFYERRDSDSEDR